MKDGAVLRFNLGCALGPELHFEEENLGAELPALAKSITALHMYRGQLFAGTCGRCFWHLDGEQREFHLPRTPEGEPPTATSLVAVPKEAGLQLWVGMDTGSLAVFEVETGMLVRTFSCGGPEIVVALAFSEKTSVVFALSAHKRVGIWDTDSYACLQKYPAELMTCGADLSAMGAFDVVSLGMSLLVLAGVDGSLCLRRITRREDRKLNCILLWYLGDGGMECPITSVNFHYETETVLLGDAGCRVQLQNIKEHVSTSQEMLPVRKAASQVPEPAGAAAGAMPGATEPPLPPPPQPPSPSQISPAAGEPRRDAELSPGAEPGAAEGAAEGANAAFPVFAGQSD
ncbi:unnamed protein product [Effrenium voratum]|nr:unnamed protein product [Effrenium voratum]